VAVAAVAALAQPARPRPAAAPSQTSQVYEPSAQDLYGFEEAPSALPPVMPRSGLGTQTAEEEGPPKKKKKKGFFSGGAKKKSSGGSFRLTGVGSGGWRLGIFLFFVIAGIIGRASLHSKADVETFVHGLISSYNSATLTLKTIKNQATAQTAAPKVRADLDKIIKMFESAKGKKAEQTDIDDVANRLSPQLASAAIQFQQERMRVEQIPSVAMTLNMMPQLERLETLALEAGKNK
jgi:hypothetical protein